VFCSRLGHNLHVVGRKYLQQSCLIDLGYVEVLDNIFLSRNFCDMNNLIKIADPVGPEHFAVVESEKKTNRTSKTSIQRIDINFGV
jgi:hypothetical protein